MSALGELTKGNSPKDELAEKIITELKEYSDAFLDGMLAPYEYYNKLVCLLASKEDIATNEAVTRYLALKLSS